MEQFVYHNQLLALHVKKILPGVTPLTIPSEALQALAMNYAKGMVVRPHAHTPKERITKELHECIVLVKGKLKATLYTHEGEIFKEVIIKPGELFFTFRGGHGFEVLEEGTQFFEIKNGPYEDDKIPVSPNK